MLTASQSRIGAGRREAGTVYASRRSRRGTILLAALATLVLATTAEAGWYNPAWLYRKPLTLNGGLVPAAQTDFPVLVSLTDAAGLGANAQATGNDILFTAGDGTTKLNHEIESYTTLTGVLVAWVRVPALASPSDTTIYMYYGNAAAGNQQNKNAVWDTGFKGVWHLSEAGAAPASYLDSTIYANNATSPSHPNTVGGRIGNARNFNGTTNYITAANTVSLQLDDEPDPRGVDLGASQLLHQLLLRSQPDRPKGRG